MSEKCIRPISDSTGQARAKQIKLCQPNRDDLLNSVLALPQTHMKRLAYTLSKPSVRRLHACEYTQAIDVCVEAYEPLYYGYPLTSVSVQERPS